MKPQIHKVQHPLPAQICYGFFGRVGGVSKGIYQSLNCGKGSGDDPKCVAQNLKIVSTALAGELPSPQTATQTATGLPPIPIQTANQQHTNKVAVITELTEPLPIADGLVTTRRGLAMGVLTADCVPILLFSHSPSVPPSTTTSPSRISPTPPSVAHPTAPSTLLPSTCVVAAAHGGWQGLNKGIVAKVVAQMRKLALQPPTNPHATPPATSATATRTAPPATSQATRQATPPITPQETTKKKPVPITAMVGPAIGVAHYQVGKDFPVREELRQFITPNHHFDLSKAATYLLKQQGVETILHCPHSSYEAGFFSRRRSLAEGNSDYGRQISAIFIA